MMKRIGILVCVAMLLAGAARAEELPNAARETAQEATQIVAVEWASGVTATLTLYEKTADGAWETRMTADALVGEKGLGKTREGDKMTPEGAFRLSTPFGLCDDPGARMPGYIRVTEDHYWSGASGTADYNRLIDLRARADYEPTANDEHLIDYPGYYDYALFIEYNAEGAENAGSAIFLHCKGEKASTSGCVAIDRERMIELLRALDEGAMIVLYRADAA